MTFEITLFDYMLGMISAIILSGLVVDSWHTIEKRRLEERARYWEDVAMDRLDKP